MNINVKYPIGHYGLEVQAPKERYWTKVYKRLQDNEREVKGMSFTSHVESLKQECLDIFKGVESDIK